MSVAALVTVLVLLSWPVPAALARWRGAAADPRRALLLWAALSVLWLLTLADLAAATLPPAARTAGAAGALVAVPLLAAVSYAVDAARGGRHAARLRLLGDWDPASRVLAVPAGGAVAHTLPAWGRGIVVVSSAGLAGLSPAERVAVMAHECAHARGRHHLVKAWFTAWRRLVPLPGPRLASSAVDLLLEVLADHAACRAAGSSAVASALWSWCLPHARSGEAWRPGPQTLTRLRCLVPQ